MSSIGRSDKVSSHLSLQTWKVGPNWDGLVKRVLLHVSNFHPVKAHGFESLSIWKRAQDAINHQIYWFLSIQLDDATIAKFRSRLKQVFFSETQLFWPVHSCEKTLANIISFALVCIAVMWQPQPQLIQLLHLVITVVQVRDHRAD